MKYLNLQTPLWIESKAQAERAHEMKADKLNRLLSRLTVISAAIGLVAILVAVEVITK